MTLPSLGLSLINLDIPFVLDAEVELDDPITPTSSSDSPSNAPPDKPVPDCKILVKIPKHSSGLKSDGGLGGWMRCVRYACSKAKPVWYAVGAGGAGIKGSIQSSEKRRAQ